MHKCRYTDRLEIKNGKITRIVHAYFKSKKYENEMDVYKSDEDGKNYCRNVYYNTLAGYGVVFKGERIYSGSCCYYGNDYVDEIQPYLLTDDGGRKILPLYCSNSATDEDLEIIMDKYRDFRYVLKKWKNRDLSMIMEVLKIWKDHKEIEILLSYGFDKIAFNRKFYALKENKKKEVISYLRKYGEEIIDNGMNLNEIFTAIKCGYSPDMCYKLRMIRRGKFSADEKSYAIRNLESSQIYDYMNYIETLKFLDKNLDDGFWHYPANFKKQYEKILKEKMNYLDNLEKEKMKLYEDKVSRFSSLEEMLDGYNIFVPKTIHEIERQAKELHQCLMSADYPKKVINDECVLVFIHRNNRPYATVEVKEENTIGQFYLDELDRDNMYPSENLRHTFGKWLKNKNLMKKIA